MKTNKIKKLEKQGWKVGSAADFLNLFREEATYIEMKLALARQLQKKRRSKHLTQQALATHIHSYFIILSI